MSMDPNDPLLSDTIAVECPVCMGVKRDCKRCGGYGEVPLNTLTDDEKDLAGWVNFTQQGEYQD